MKNQNQSVQTHKKTSSDLNITYHNSLNDSTAKMKYSFPKSSRFLENKNILQTHYYDIGSTFQKRAPSLGYGNKTIIQNGTDKPSPNTYYLKGMFQSDSKNKGVTIGLGRDKVRHNSIFQIRNITPSALDYNPVYKDEGIKFSLRHKLEDKSEEWHKKVPGPGTYDTIDPMNQKCSNFVSRFESAPSTKFSGLPRIVKELNPQSPGPAKYDVTNFNKVTSKFKGAVGTKFGTSQRKQIVESNTKYMPGPGSYNHYSEFAE